MKDNKVVCFFYFIAGAIVLLLIKVKLMDVYLDKSLDIDYIQEKNWWV